MLSLSIFTERDPSCFLDASKAFDRVNLFAVYNGELLISYRTGCYSGCFFVGALCYADDIVLLAHSPSGLILLSECECFSRNSELNFNASKTQLICFRLLVLPDGMFCFFGHILSFSNCVHHLGHVLSFNLDVYEDINRVSMGMSRKANYLTHTFKSCSLLVKTFLFTSHCLSLYGAVSCFLCCNQIKCLEATFNNVLRNIWNLPIKASGFYIVSPVFRVCITLLFIYLHLLLAKQLPQIVV